MSILVTCGAPWRTAVVSKIVVSRAIVSRAIASCVLASILAVAKIVAIIVGIPGAR